MSLRRMRIACCMPKVTNTPSKYVILALFRRLQWLHERVSLLRHTYLAFLVIVYMDFVLCKVGTVFLICNLDYRQH